MENVGLTSSGNVRLFDFGLSKEVRSPTILFKGINPEFSSPEVYKKKPADLASDRWSYGVILSNLFQGKHPFPKNAIGIEYGLLLQNREEESQPYAILVYQPEKLVGKALQKVAAKGKLDVKEIEEKKAKRLVKKCLNVNPTKRPDRLAVNEFFKNVKNIPSFVPSNVPRVSCSSLFPFKPINMESSYQKKLLKHMTRIPTKEYCDSLMKLSSTESD